MWALHTSNSSYWFHVARAYPRRSGRKVGPTLDRTPFHHTATHTRALSDWDQLDTPIHPSHARLWDMGGTQSPQRKPTQNGRTRSLEAISFSFHQRYVTKWHFSKTCCILYHYYYYYYYYFLGVPSKPWASPEYFVVIISSEMVHSNQKEGKF